MLHRTRAECGSFLSWIVLSGGGGFRRRIQALIYFFRIMSSPPPGTPPPSPEFLAEDVRHITSVGIIIVFVLAFVVVALRFYARIRLTRSFGLDDWLMALSVVRCSNLALSRLDVKGGQT